MAGGGLIVLKCCDSTDPEVCAFATACIWCGLSPWGAFPDAAYLPAQAVVRLVQERFGERAVDLVIAVH